MKKIIAVVIAALLCLSTDAFAQQFVTPVYSQNSLGGTQSYQPYSGSQTPSPLNNQAPASAPQPTSAPIQLSGSSQNNALSNTGYGTAVYSNNSASPAAPAAPSAIPTTYSPPPSYAPTSSSYATYAAAPKSMMPSYNWTGCYAGAYFGGDFGGNVTGDPLLSDGSGGFATRSPYNATALSNSYNTGSGIMGGGTGGCNYEIPTRAGAVTGIVLGVEAEGGSFGIANSSIDPNSATVRGDTKDKTRIGDWDAIVGGRVGVAFDRTLVYGKFGMVFSDATSKITDSCNTGSCGASTINAGGHKEIADAAFGAGVEYALTDKWSVKGEYMYLDTSDSYQVCGPAGGLSAGGTFCSAHELEGSHTIKLGLNYHFGAIDFGDRYVKQTGPSW